MKIEFDHPTRGKSYREANDGYPEVRRAEIDAMLHAASALPGQKALDFGCGSGVITFSIARSVGPEGHIIALDNSADSLAVLPVPDDIKNLSTLVVQDGLLNIPDNSLNLITTLANFHHVPDKLAMFHEFYRILKPGGRVVVGDVADNTSVQRYFDTTVHEFCSTQHEHKFLDELDCRFISEACGMDCESWSLKQVPWIYENAESCGRYLKLIHDATCDEATCLAHAKRDLGYHESSAHFLLFWKLFYWVSRKPS